MKNRRQSTKTVSIDIERTEKANTQRAEKIAQLQAEIDVDCAKIKDLKKLHTTLYRSEFKEKIARDIGDKKLTDDEMTKLILITRQIVDNIDSFDVNLLTENKPTTPEISSLSVELPKIKPTKIE